MLLCCMISLPVLPPLPAQKWLNNLCSGNNNHIKDNMSRVRHSLAIALSYVAARFIASTAVQAASAAAAAAHTVVDAMNPAPTQDRALASSCSR